uniref:Reverse transcriptase domain-containing protein n=1 Tax=Tanacetum cinerariifolium TaxID=118510 RepID=A0A699I097_TANCI|nr:reverse transcriptase domain-containing protein [Tanacetum cinerariifolium]
MPFGLKNAGATYQRLVDKAFDSQVDRNIEVYVDELVTKSHIETEMLRDIDETFRTLQKINMKLNPKKYTFREVEGMFLGYMISPEGIKPYPDRTKVVIKVLATKTLKKCIKKSDFHWTPEAEQAFKQLKQHLSELPMLVAPKPKEELTVYLSASHGAISAVLMTKRDTVQMPVYFMGVRNVHVSVDSKLVANQVLGTYFAKEENMITYLEKAKSLVSGFTNFSISQVSRSKNKKADALSKITSTSFTHLSKQVLVEVLKEKSIQEKEVETMVEEDGPTWMTPIMKYLKDGTLPDDRKEAIKLRIKAIQYELLEGVLYRRKGQVFDSPYGLFYEVDRCESRGNNYRHSGEEVYIGQHSVPLRPTRRDSLGQRRGDEAIREAKAKLKMTKYYNARVQGVTFRPRDFVYRSNDASHVVDGGSLAQSRKDLMRSQKHSEMEHTG